ncbi:MAG: glycosyltransferase family 9 protein [Roseibacillus sp.]
MHENNWKLFRESAKRIGIEKPKVLPASPLKYLPGDDGIVTENDDSCSDGRRVLIHPGSSRATTQWEYSRFVLLANRLSSDGYSVTWMLEGERPAGLTAEVDALPRDSLENFVRKLRDFDLFVGNNSGPMHLADVVGLRLVIIPGPAAVGWDPYWAKVIRMLRVEGLACQPCEVLGQLKPSCRLTSEPHACQGRIRVEDVYSTILALGRGRV